MLGVPQFGNVTVVSNYGIVGSSSFGAALVTNATTLLDGSVVECISAANNVQDSWGISIEIWNGGLSTTASQQCIDILYGGATDDVLIPALICGFSLGGCPRSYFFPVHIPAGVRIAASIAGVRTSITNRVGVTLYGGTPPPFAVGSHVVAYGTQVNNARGVAITPTASGGTASVTQMTASTGEDLVYVIPGWQPGGTTVAERQHNVGIGVGASTEERVGTWTFFTASTEAVTGPFPTLGAFCNIPAGQRLTWLHSNSGTNDATAGDGLIYGVAA